MPRMMASIMRTRRKRGAVERAAVRSLPWRPGTTVERRPRARKVSWAMREAGSASGMCMAARAAKEEAVGPGAEVRTSTPWGCNSRARASPKDWM